MDSHSLVDEVQAIIVSAAREELLPRFARVERTRKRDGSILTEADTAMQTRIAASLQQLSPDVLFLGEEMEADEQAALLESGQPVWCLFSFPAVTPHSFIDYIQTNRTRFHICVQVLQLSILN